MLQLLVKASYIGLKGGVVKQPVQRHPLHQAGARGRAHSTAQQLVLPAHEWAPAYAHGKIKYYARVHPRQLAPVLLRRVSLASQLRPRSAGVG